MAMTLLLGEVESSHECEEVIFPKNQLRNLFISTGVAVVACGGDNGDILAGSNSNVWITSCAPIIKWTLSRQQNLQHNHRSTRFSSRRKAWCKEGDGVGSKDGKDCDSTHTYTTFNSLQTHKLRPSK